MSYSKPHSQAVTELVFSECIKRSEVGPENGSEQPSWSQDTKPEGMVAGGWSVSIPEEGTACVKSETVQAWYFSRLALQSV